MKIGVVGASGTLGRVLVKKLATPEFGHDVACLLRRPDDQLERLATGIVSPDGVMSRDAVRQLANGRDVVINLAARNPAGQPQDLKSVPDFMAANAVGPALVADACASNDTPLLHFSSVAVYETAAYAEAVELDEAVELPSLDRASVDYFEQARILVERIIATDVHETSAMTSTAEYEALTALPYPSQASVYGLSKLIGERAVVDSAARSCCVRLSDVFGPGHESRGVIVDHLRALASSPADVTVNLDFRETAYFIMIDDALSAAVMLAEKLARHDQLPGILNLAGHRFDEPSLLKALARLPSEPSTEAPTLRVAPAKQRKFDRRYDPALLQKTLPDFALTNFDESLARTWRALPR